MGIINELIEKRAQDISSLKQPSERLKNWFGGSAKTTAGVSVTPESSLKSTTIYACVSILSNSVAQMPLNVYRKTDNVKEKATDHPAYNILKNKPNPEMHSFEFKRLEMAHLTLWGNSYSEIVFNGGGEPAQLWPIPPWRVEPKRNERGELIYEIKLNNNEKTILSAEQTIHVKGFGIEGLKGLSPIGLHRQAVGLSLATEEFGSRFFGEGANFGGIIHHDRTHDEAFKRMKKDITNKYSGLGRSHRLLFLEEGMQYERAGIPPEDAQFLQTREFQVRELASIYNVPLHLLQLHEKSTSWGSGIEEINLGYIIFTLNPYLINFEKEYDRKLIEENNANEYFTKHEVEGLLRGDSKTRAEFYNRMFNMGAYTINEIREKEDKKPIGPEGDVNYIPMNMMSAEAAAQEAEEGNENNNNNNRNQNHNHNHQKKDDKVILTKMQRRSARQRFRIANRWQRNFKNAAARVVKRETKNLRKNVKNYFDEDRSQKQKRSMAGWESFLNKYYEDFHEFIGRQMQTNFLTFAEEINEAAAAEIGTEPDMDNRAHRFVNDYKKVFAGAYSRSSKNQLLQVAREADKDNKNIVEEVETRLDEWEERRPQKVAKRETVQLSNAMALFTFAAAGIQKKRWAALGSDTCNFCQEMDGMVVGINQEFIRKDQELQSEEEDDSMRIYKGIGHPQLHGGCVCQIVAD